MNIRSFFWSAFAVLILISPCLGQGLLVSDSEVRLPRPGMIIIYPPGPSVPTPIHPVVSQLEYKISEILVEGALTDQVAEIQVSQSFVNLGSRQMEVSFVFPLPYDGAINELTLLVDGKEYPATLLPAEKARAEYEAIVRKNKDPALLEWIGTGMFRTSVFPIPAGGARKVVLKYTQLCRQSGGLTDFVFPLSTAKYTAKPIEKLSVRLTINSSEAIRNVYSPTQALKIEKPQEKTAVVTWEAKDTVPEADFRLLFDVGAEKLSTRVLSHFGEQDDEGYFLILSTPEIKKESDKPLPKTVFFVIDNSGSMSGEKIVQARDALKFVLNNLREGDLFNIITFNSTVSNYKEELQVYNDKSRAEALVFAEGIYAGGGTDINSALQRAFAQLEKAEKQPTYVFFLTDGCPTVGESSELKIARNAAKANKVRGRVFAFGVGYDLNSRLLDKLVRDSSGQSEYVKPRENIEERVSRLFNKLEAPIMTNVELSFIPAEGSESAKSGTPMVNRVYPADRFDLFAGEQLVVSGRYRFPGKGTLKIAGDIGKDGKKTEFTWPVELSGKSTDSRFAFAEKLWAARRIGDIIDELDLDGKNQELIDELVKLSIKHGILTPYTSFLTDESSQLTDRTEIRRRAGSAVGALGQNATGFSGFAQRGMKASYKQAQNFDVGANNVQAAQTAQQMNSYAPAIAGLPNTDASFNSFGRGVNTQPRFASQQATQQVAQQAAPMIQLDQRQRAALDQQLAGGNSGAIQQTMRQINNRTFFYKNNQWVDSNMTETQLNSTPRKVKQFSDEYFALIEKNGPELAPYLTFEQAVLLSVGDEIILFEP